MRSRSRYAGTREICTQDSQHKQVFNAAALDTPSPEMQVRLDTRKDCWLAVSYMPWFQYDASAGQGRGIATPSETPGRLRLKFSPSDLHIPSLSWRTTSVGIVPLPPGIAIHIHPQVREEG